MSQVERGAEQFTHRFAVEADLHHVERIFDQFDREVGWVRRPSILEGIEREQLMVSEVDGTIIAAALIYHRLDKQTTIYSIAVDRWCHGWGTGRSLLDFISTISRERGQRVIRAKCRVGEKANLFWEKTGFTIHSVQQSKFSTLNLWVRPIEGAS